MYLKAEFAILIYEMIMFSYWKPWAVFLKLQYAPELTGYQYHFEIQIQI